MIGESTISLSRHSSSSSSKFSAALQWKMCCDPCFRLISYSIYYESNKVCVSNSVYPQIIMTFVNVHIQIFLRTLTKLKQTLASCLYQGYITLKNYADQKKPLCNPFSDLLNPWSNSNFLWNQETVSLKKIQSLKQLKLDYNFNHHNLKQLDRTWSSLTQTLKFPLIVRVLAKCKEKLILQQTNHRKTWMCLSNVLIADNSGYSVLTIWDEAVADFHKNLKALLTRLQMI